MNEQPRMAQATVREVLLACLPPGVPPSFKSIDHASFVGRGRSRTITGNLTMFDGEPAVVDLTPWAFGWSHRFTSLPGGDVSFEEGQWTRVPALASPAPKGET
ncbi:hypothetical protein [Kaistia sp. UC242_56]|uniref:hypothetical protein n=1 Tax=Kaistia sp. UC242_56 TaxID=3374625 RepID=UPI003791E32E